MNNKISDGKAPRIVAPSGGVTVGVPVVVNNSETLGQLGIPVCTAAEGEEVALELKGIFRLPKVAATAIALFESVYWDVADGEFNKSASGNVGPFKPFKAAGASDTHVEVLIG